MDHLDMNTPPAARVLVVGPDQARVARTVARLTAAGLSCDTATASNTSHARGRDADPPDVVVAIEVQGTWQPTVSLLPRDIAVTGSPVGRTAPVLVLSDGAGQRGKIDALSSRTSGVWDWIEITVADDELVARINRLARIGEMAGEIRELTRRVAGMETVDRLTGLPNHRTFQEYLTAEFRRAERYASPLSLLLVDLDRFRSLNETHGHQWGDHLLQQAALGIRSLLREIDMVSRFGGEEFAVLLPETDSTDALSVATRVRVMMESVPAKVAHPTGGIADQTMDHPRLTASIGVACCPHEGTATRGQLLAAAESALRRAKDEGRNRAVLYSSPPQMPVLETNRQIVGSPGTSRSSDDSGGESAFSFGKTTP